MTNEKLKFIGSTISKVFRYLNKNVLQARMAMFALCSSLLILCSCLGLGYVLKAGDMKLIEFLRIIKQLTI